MEDVNLNAYKQVKIEKPMTKKSKQKKKSVKSFSPKFNKINTLPASGVVDFKTRVNCVLPILYEGKIYRITSQGRHSLNVLKLSLDTKIQMKKELKAGNLNILKKEGNRK